MMMMMMTTPDFRGPRRPTALFDNQICAMAKLSGAPDLNIYNCFAFAAVFARPPQNNILEFCRCTQVEVLTF